VDKSTYLLKHNIMPRKANPALLKPYKVSAELEAVIGPGPLPRGQVMKKLWEYIKANGLQDKVNKRDINADAKLAVVFGGKKKVNMFEMAKLVSAHLS
jgi:chromatin remodeling complex protein RSC6